MKGVKTVWITGASSGIGEALALTYNAKGYRTILSARRSEALESIQKKLTHPEYSYRLPLDLEQHENAEAWFHQASEFTGSIDILINNAGMGHLGTAIEMELEIERKVFEVNFWGAVALTKAVLPHMTSRNSGQIWTVSSILGHFGSPKLAAYAASKHAVLGYFESIQYELRNSEVHIGIVSPGFINTAVTINSLGPDGAPIGKNSVAQEKGMLPLDFALKFLKLSAKRRPKKHLLIGRYEIHSVPFKRYLPRLFFMVYGKLTDVTRQKKN
jgi:short-subunit dehydrogenase